VSGWQPLREAFAFLVILIIVLSSFSFLAAFARNGSPTGDGDLPARLEYTLTASFVVTPMDAYVGDLITFNASATTPYASSLNFTLYFDYYLANGSVNHDSPVETATTTGSRGWFNTTHIYNAPGNYTYGYPYVYAARLQVTDGVGGYRNITRYPQITENEAPYFHPILEEELYDVQIGVPYTISVTCWDADNDELTLTWDFGDGSIIAVNTTGPALSGVTCSQTHTWNPDPEDWYGIGGVNITYYLNLSLTDGRDHWTNTTSEVIFPLEHNYSPSGTISTSLTKVDPTDEVWLRGTASDPEGEPLTWTFVFSDSEEDFLVMVYHTGLTEPGATVYQNASYVFSEVGVYTVSLFISDVTNPALQVYPHNVSAGDVTIESVNNSIPFVLTTIRISDYYTRQQDVRVNETTGLAIAVLSIQTNDNDGDILYATWAFGDGSEPAYNQSLGGVGTLYTFKQIHEFPGTGQYNVSVMITDGRDGHEVLRYRLLNVSSNNSRPEVFDLDVIYSNGSYGLPGTVVVIILTLYDLERDPLQVAWDFKDGSPIEWTNVSSFAENGTAVCTVNHIFEEIGNYRVMVNFTDGIVGIRGLHAASCEIFITIKIPKIIPVRIWDLWDYASLSTFLLICGLLVMWAVMGSMKRKRLDMMGTTLEEYMLRKQEIEEYERKHGGEGGSV
jgi:hypothetical protein